MLKNMSPRLIKKPTVLKDSSSIIRRDSNILRLSVEAKKIEDEYKEERVMSARKSRLNVSNFENTQLNMP
jgi:hypothetical protein